MITFKELAGRFTLRPIKGLETYDLTTVEDRTRDIISELYKILATWEELMLFQRK